MTAYILTLVILLFFLFYLYKQGQKWRDFSPYLLPCLFLIKLGSATFFLYVYTNIYGNGTLSQDPGDFLKESKILNDVFYQSPKDYLIFFFGLEPNLEFIYKYLIETTHWTVRSTPIFNDSKNVIRINSLTYFISQGWSFTHVLIGSIFSYTAIIITYQWVKLRSSLNRKTIFFILFFIPSLLFWSSSFLKEPFMIFGLACTLYGIFHSNIPTAKRIIISLAGLFFGLSFKPYILVFLLLSFLFHFLQTAFKNKSKLYPFLIFVLLITVPLLYPKTNHALIDKLSRQQTNFINVGAGGLHISRNDSILYFNVHQMDEIYVENNQAFIQQPTEGFYVTDNHKYTLQAYLAPKSSAPYNVLYHREQSSSYFTITRLNNSWKTFFSTLPEALSNALLRPFWNDGGSWLMTLAKIENILLIILTFIFILKGKFRENPNLPIILTLALFIFITMLLIGYTTPVTGAIVRYKIPALLALGIIINLGFNTKKQT